MDYPLAGEAVGRWGELASTDAILPTQDVTWAVAAAASLPGDPVFLPLEGADGWDGVAQLVRRGTTLELAGARELGEPSDFLVRAPAMAPALVERVVATREPLFLQRIPAASPTVASLREACDGWAWLQVATAPSHPTIPLDDRWSEPGGGLSSSRRSALRRSRRKAEALGAIEVELLTPAPEEVEGLLDVAFEIESRSWKGIEGTAVSQVAPVEAFFRRYAHELAQRGKLRIDLLRIGERRVAMQLGARFGRSHWLFKIGYDAAFRPASPGQLLLAESVAAAARDGLETYELLGFCEEWTEAWTQEVRTCAKVTVMPRNGRGALAYGAIHWRGAERHLRREAVKAKVGVLDVAKASYVAGPELDDALLEEARYAGAGYPTTVGFWNGPSDPPTRVAAEARASAEALPPGSEVSIKLAPLGGDGPVLDELVALCAERDLTLHLDALRPDGADATRDAALRLSQEHPGRVGCTLPGRWARSVADARELSGTGVRVRVVKGEVAAGEEGSEAEMGEGFLAVVAALAGGSCLVEVASHDAPLVKRALGVLLESGTECEHQVLHAMHSASAIRAAHRLGVPTRVYVPYGTGRVPYTLATLHEHPTSTLTLARDLLRLPPRRPAIWVSHLFPFTDLFPF